MIGVALGPRADKSTTSENLSPIRASDGHLRAGKVDVINDEGASRCWRTVAAERGQNTYGSICHCAVHEHYAANILGTVLEGRSHVNTDSAIVDVDGFESPQPVPVHVDGGVAVVEGHVSAGELLIAEKGTVVASVEYQIGHETP